VKKLASILSSSVLLCAFSAIPLANASAAVEPVLKKGVIVESLIHNQEGEEAGIRPGDVLLAWSRGDAKGQINSPFDLPYVRMEQASRGPLRLIGFRGAQKRSWLIGSDLWGIWTHPNFQGELLSIYSQGQQLAQAGRLNEALDQWRAAAAIAENSGIPWLSPWLLSRAARAYSGQPEKRDDLYRQSIEQATKAGPEVRAELLRERAEGCQQLGDFVRLEQYHQEQLVELRKLDGETMAIANAMLSLAWVSHKLGDLAKAESYAREALTISQAEAPKSAATVVGLVSLGSLLQDEGDLTAATTCYQHALDSLERYFPTNDHLAQIRLAGIFGGFGGLADRRGEFGRARTYYQRALSAAERADGDNPESATIAEALDNLAEYLIDRGDLATAQSYSLRTLAIWRKLTPGGMPVSTSLRNLGKIARVRGDWAEANEYYQQALAIGERVAPQSGATRRFLVGLGYVARDSGDPVSAEAYFRKALAIMDKSDPNSLDHAETLADLAGVLYRQKKLDAATKTYQIAIAELEDKASGWDSIDEGGLEEGGSHYRAYRSAYYKEYVDLLVQQGQAKRAFEAMEGSRARTLFEMLSESRIDIHRGADSILLARERELRQLITTKSQYRIRLLTEKNTDELLSSLDREVSNLRDRHARLEADIRASNPGFAALTDPQPLNANQIQQLLDPETVLLEYSLGEERSYLWLVTDSSLAVYELPKRAEIESLARHFYRTLTARASRASADPEVNLASWTKADALSQKLASDLSQVLLGPVTDLIAGKRLLVVSDGALQYVPFAALPAPQNAKEPLIVEHEILNLPSASVLAEIRRASADRPRASREVAVLADPVFDPGDERVESGADKSTPRRSFIRSSQRVSRSASDVGLIGKRGFRLDRLVYSRHEAEVILAVTPRAKALEALDFQANRATALNPELARYRIVHFATHGFLDSKRPELSGLVLSLVNRQGKPQDGFLGLEDVYNMKLPVDMVVLSGCQTGLGEDISGEGLIGLTRGFMYAGASRVVASLWSVDDFTTSQLMAKFYRAMEREKMPPAAALRKAQIEMWRHTGWRAPYYWAAFQLQGEWR
jgi:CHAT domain-containing protein/tetratricopeptide (TPR) repeat protein